jgi:elongation factor P--beta-lysine ligase
MVAVHAVVEVSPGVWRLRAVVEAEAARDAARAEGKRAGLEMAAQWHEAEAESWWQRCEAYARGTIEHQQAREQARAHEDMAAALRSMADAAGGA